ncbi:MAG TPA: hypothetical protein PKC39_12075 [Ferruginibacter sp.]|nr:hypothetical protein [Ferruginibacter sp.]HMP21687.1 hypothetical protein [Ferruginibacter sp.]
MKFQLAIQKKFIQVFAFAIVALMPAITLAQPPGPEDGEVGPDVPFDANMNLIFLAVAVLFAAFVMYRKFRKSATA